MEYRHLGKSGIQVSELSFGSWVTFHTQADVNAAKEMMSAAYDAGVNFFDNAEAYANGQSEKVMGDALRQLGWRRGSYLVSTKLYWGLHDNVNEKNTLNRKRLIEGINGSLQRLQLDYVDIIYCHRPDKSTPIEETVWAMHNIIEWGKAMYWGTSEWAAAEIVAAIEIAERHHLHKPQVARLPRRTVQFFQSEEGRRTANPGENNIPTIAGCACFNQRKQSIFSQTYPAG